MSFTKEQLQTRVSDLSRALEQSMANHNALAGRLAESQELLSMFDSVIEPVDPVITE